eukprot:COSAG01_NODE_570_length_15328_cov_82.520783_19_plen_112_part_00
MPLWASDGLRPAIPPSCPPPWRRLCEDSWAADPASRPSFAQIGERLRQCQPEVRDWPDPNVQPPPLPSKPPAEQPEPEPELEVSPAALGSQAPPAGRPRQTTSSSSATDAV